MNNSLCNNWACCSQVLSPLWAIRESVLYEHKALKRHCGINAHYDCVTCLFATLVSLSRFNGVLSKLMHFKKIEYSTALQSFTFVSSESCNFSHLEITLPFACVIPQELAPLTTHWDTSQEFLSRCLLLNPALLGKTWQSYKRNKNSIVRMRTNE